MRKVARAQILQRLLRDGGARACGDGNGKAACISRQNVKDMGRRRHTHPKDRETRRTFARWRNGQQRHAGISHGPQLREPGMALEIEAPRLNRAAGR